MAAHFHLALLVAASISHFVTATGHDNLSKLNTLDNMDDTKKISALQHASGYAISRQNNLELHFVCHTC